MPHYQRAVKYPRVFLEFTSSFAIVTVNPKSRFFQIPGPQKIIADNGRVAACDFHPLAPRGIETAIPMCDHVLLKLNNGVSADPNPIAPQAFAIGLDLDGFQSGHPKCRKARGSLKSTYKLGGTL